VGFILANKSLPQILEHRRLAFSDGMLRIARAAWAEFTSMM
jgi:hypothetical protein